MTIDDITKKEESNKIEINDIPKNDIESNYEEDHSEIRNLDKNYAEINDTYANKTEVKAYAPATVANLGPGFDILGLAIDGLGDTVTARFSGSKLLKTPLVRITRISSNDEDLVLPMDPERNTAGIAAIATLKKAGLNLAVDLEIEKGMPVGSGLGSSAASSVAAAFAVNMLIGGPLRKSELIDVCLEAESLVSGRHADNVAPALLGGLVLVRSVDPIDFIRIPLPKDLHIVVVTPNFQLNTRHARAVLPGQVSLSAMVKNSANIATFISACYTSDLNLLSRCLSEDPVTSSRVALIPAARDVISSAISAGAIGSSVSGAGPSIFALTHSFQRAEHVAKSMQVAFLQFGGLNSKAIVSPANCRGVRLI